MSGIRLAPNNTSRYVIEQQDPGADMFFNSNFTYEDLLLAKGPKVRDYELIEYANQYASSFSRTLSNMTTPFLDMVIGSGAVRDVKSNNVRWRKYGEPDRRTISMGNANTNTDYAGLNGIGKIVLDREGYGVSQQLAPIKNKRCIIRLESEARYVGPRQYEYDFTPLEKDDFVPAEFFAQGEYWIPMGNSTSFRDSATAIPTLFGMGFTYLEFEVQLTTMMFEATFDEETILRDKNLVVSKCDEMGKVMKRGVVPVIELEWDQSIKNQKEMYLMYGSASTHRLDGNSKQKVTTGPGFFAFLEESNVIKYSPYTNSIDLMVDVIKQFWYDRIPVNQRRLLLYTGEGGLDLWHTWIEEKYGNTVTVQDVNFILNKVQAVDPTKQGYALNNYQFREYKIQPFGTITVAHWKLLDDTRVTGQTFPGSIYPVQSFEFIAMDIGLGEPNIQLFQREDKNFRGVIPGLFSPYGHVGEQNPVFKSPGDANLGFSYKKIHRESFGLGVMDVERILRFVPSV